MYKKKTYKLGNTIEVEEFHTPSAREKGMERIKWKKPTPEQMEKNNQRNKEKLCRRRLRKYFSKGDYFSTLTYAPEQRPEDMESAKADFQRFIRIVKTEYKKRGHDIRWMRNIECGSRGAWHVHMVMNRIPETDMIIANAWKKGKAISQLMYERGNFSDLAAYITKTPKTDKKLRFSNYSVSRNMPAPVPEVKTYKRSTFKNKEISVREGWTLTEHFEGINVVTGYPFREYTLQKMERKRCTKSIYSSG